MKKETGKEYEAPALTVVSSKMERGYATSVPESADVSSNNMLGSWYSGDDAWGGSSFGSGSSMGSWTDNGGDAWE